MTWKANIMLALATLATFALLLNILSLRNTLDGIIFGLLYLTSLSWLIGESFSKLTPPLRVWRQTRSPLPQGEESKNLPPKVRGEKGCITWTLGFITLLAILILSGTIFFYLWELGAAQLVIITIIPLIIATLACLNSPKPARQVTSYKSQVTKKEFILTISYLVFTALAFYILLNNTTATAIRSPWEVVPSSFFIVYFMATVLLLLNLVKNYNLVPRTYNLLLISTHLFLTYSVALIVYQINFGFDPFVHQATERLLSLTGTISPKPLLYIGQYSLVIWLSKALTVPIVLIDKLLVPVLASLLIPPAAFFALTKGFKLNERAALISVLALPLLLIPWYFTVPQNLANLFLLLIVLLSVTIFNAAQPRMGLFVRMGKYFLLWLLAITTFVIHPFTGIPAIIYLVFITLLAYFNNPNRQILHSRHSPKFVLLVFFLIALFALPLALNIGTGVANQTAQPENFQLSTFNFQLASWTPFYSIFHLVYLFKSNHTLILILLTLTGIWLVKKNKSLLRATYSVLLPSLITTFLILAVDTLALRYIKLPIISYELPEFIVRFWQIGLLFLVPIILYSISKIIGATLSLSKGLLRLRGTSGASPEISRQARDNKLKNGQWSMVNGQMLRVALIFFLSLFLTSGVYLLYPRDDAFTTGRAFATSSADLEAVRWIEADAAGHNYIVLSNQAVAAVALQEFGFKKYYHNLSAECQMSNGSKPVVSNCQMLFFYPIPTTSPLYQLYLGIVYQAPTKKRLEQALDLTGAEIAYFVINDYWLDAEKIVNQTKDEFGNIQLINNGTVTIFKLSKD